ASATARVPAVRPIDRPAVTSAGIWIPSVRPAAAACCARRSKECPVSEESAASAAKANALDSETQPGDAGVRAGGVQRAPRAQRLPDKVATFPTSEASAAWRCPGALEAFV